MKPLASPETERRWRAPRNCGQANGPSKQDASIEFNSRPPDRRHVTAGDVGPTGRAPVGTAGHGSTRSPAECERAYQRLTAATAALRPVPDGSARPSRSSPVPSTHGTTPRETGAAASARQARGMRRTAPCSTPPARPRSLQDVSAAPQSLPAPMAPPLRARPPRSRGPSAPPPAPASAASPYRISDRSSTAVADRNASSSRSSARGNMANPKGSRETAARFVLRCADA